jgi:rare lipoprotein A (peptidoglycan hydrolase)
MEIQMPYQSPRSYAATSNNGLCPEIHRPKPFSWKGIQVYAYPIAVRKWLSVLSCVALVSALAVSGCSSKHSNGQDKLTQLGKDSAAAKPLHKEVGEASWYGPGFQGKETANGESFDQKELTAAHPTLPMGTKAKVTNLENGKKVDVRINDRGPYSGDRAIDLSGAAAKKLDMKGDGTAQVKIETKSTNKASAAKTDKTKN